MVVSGAKGLVACVADKGSDDGVTLAPQESPNVWVKSSKLVWGARIDGGCANNHSEMVWIEDVNPQALPNTAERRTATKTEFCAQKGTGVDEQLISTILEDTPAVKGKMLYCSYHGLLMWET